ncbi:MAG: catalase [Candidatus Melainabacteria bacterium]|nr:MAG: catalase [Candidatus Melainabacteria bacterium]
MPSNTLITDLLDSLDQLFGLHPGFRPVHAKGVMCSGIFTPSPQAASLTRAPHASRESTPVVVRFSNFAGVPTIRDNDPNGAGPRGFAVRFYLAEHVHTDIIGHSHDGFPTKTGEEFLELARALAASGPEAAKPTALDKFFAKYPKAKKFLEDPKPIPVSYATESYFAVTAFKFTNKDGLSRYGRFRIRPEGGNQYLTTGQAQSKSENFLADELSERLAKGPIKLRIVVQLAATEDNVSDSTIIWPETRTEVEFGTITLKERVNAADPEMRKIIFDPIPRVDGIDPSDDPLIEVRSAIYLLSGRRRRSAEAH